MSPFPPYHKTLPHVTKDTWRDLAAKKRQSLYEAIPEDWLLPKGKYDDLLNVMDVPRQCGLLSTKELEITEIDDVAELAKKIADREYTSVEVALAFSKRAAIAHQLTNCLTEVLFARAAKRAKELDDFLQETGRTVGPLHGVPVSLKDQFDIKGVELTMGYGSYLGRISPANSSMVDLLEASGAILYVRTNVPQTLMIGDTFNHVFGRTCNPRHRKMSPGGSSGGEGALIALKGSIIGIGTDLGGSVRIPSAMCGLVTIRSSSRRLPYGKTTNCLLGQESVLPVAGPMCRTLAQAYDTALQHKKLSFGYCKTDGHVHVAPPVSRAIDETVQALRAAGHDVFEFDMTRYKRACPLVCEILSADGGQDVNSILITIDEPVIDEIVLGNDATEKSVFELHQMNREKEAMQQEMLKDWLATTTQCSTGRPMDALIFPAVASPVRRFTDDKYSGLTGIFNMLDLPSCVFPVTTADPAKDPRYTDIEYFSDVDKALCDQYDPEMGSGMPVAIQVVGRRWQEESLLAVAKVVANAVGKAL